MKIEVIAGWQIGLGLIASKDGVGILLPIVVIMIEFGHYRKFEFIFQKHF